VISSYFWEHIPPDLKNDFLSEIKRVLKPGGRIIFLYDLDSKNILISALKKQNIFLYNKLFLEKDGHLGYESIDTNKQRFLDFGFELIKHFGMERTILQSSSVFEKTRNFKGVFKYLALFMNSSLKSRKIQYLYILFLRIIDTTISRLFSQNRARIVISIFKKSV
jgi:SAM-dependent methyltransferase